MLSKSLAMNQSIEIKTLFSVHFKVSAALTVFAPGYTWQWHDSDISTFVCVEAAVSWRFLLLRVSLDCAGLKRHHMYRNLIFEIL